MICNFVPRLVHWQGTVFKHFLVTRRVGLASWSTGHMNEQYHNRTLLVVLSSNLKVLHSVGMANKEKQHCLLQDGGFAVPPMFPCCSKCKHNFINQPHNYLPRAMTCQKIRKTNAPYFIIQTLRWNMFLRFCTFMWQFNSIIILIFSRQFPSLKSCWAFTVLFYKVAIWGRDPSQLCLWLWGKTFHLYFSFFTVFLCNSSRCLKLIIIICFSRFPMLVDFLSQSLSCQKWGDEGVHFVPKLVVYAMNHHFNVHVGLIWTDCDRKSDYWFQCENRSITVTLNIMFYNSTIVYEWYYKQHTVGFVWFLHSVDFWWFCIGFI